MAEVVVSVVANAAIDRVWGELVDWDNHGEWMLATRVQRTTDDGDGVGAGLVAVTKLGPLRLRDPMTVSQWDPPPADPARCVVEHTGTLIRGSGAFEVVGVGTGRSRVVWSEWVDMPLGLLGEFGWLALRPVVAAALRTSLRRLARRAEEAR
jgi:hypothetical protein